MKRYHYLSICMLLFISCIGENKLNNLALENVTLESEKKVVLNEDYNELLTLEMAAKVTGFDPSKAKKLNSGKGMLSEILRYYWENGREVVKEKSASNRKRVTYPRTDFVQISFVDFEADRASFSDFISVETHPELSEIAALGEIFYWNSEKNYLEVYSNGVSFRAMADVSNAENINKEKTIELAQLIIKEKLK